MSLASWLHKSPYWLRFLLLACAATGINMLGLALTQWLSWSLLFFDMIGTAVASLLGGAVAGMLVALASGALGSLLAHDPTYLVYGYVNIIGALVWAVLPRTGRPIFGCYVFNLGDGATYRRAFFNIMVLGIVAGLATSLAAWTITVFVLPASGDNLSFGANTAAGTNNRVLTAALIGITHADTGIVQKMVILLSSSITNIPDKIIATASAVLIIISYKTLPNYKRQKITIRSNSTPIGATIVSNRFLFLAICAGQAVLFVYVIRRLTGWDHHTGVMALLSAIVAILILADPVYFRSVDRDLSVSPEICELFYEIPQSFHMGHHKAVFEDILKLMAVSVSGASFIIAISSGSACVPETMESFVRCGPLYELAAVNALIVTGFRYMCVVFMRVSNRN
ncbi:hypothetical protein [Sphingomonas sp.]|uniref:hypothetical protein n=1 Tax=Sphingomonas sp. TaxID=28214 RepID=UPI001B0BB97A|nr:hypothetical protein [Sphingomonas sp.]MBO9714005.1 hypothetical protein [Sphingomonas sp.]